MKTSKLKPLKILFFFTIIISINSCNEDNINIEGELAFYLLEAYNTSEESMEILDEGIILMDEAVIRSDEILSYNSTTHSFEVSENAAERLQDLYQSAFAITIDREVVYTAYFWSGFSSHIVDWVIADILTLEMSNILKIQLGYPHLMEDMNIPDRRNDSRILSVLERDKKLID